MPVVEPARDLVGLFMGVKVKAAVIYHSESGNTAKMASCIVEGLLEVEGIEAKAFNLEAVEADFAKESRIIIVGSPVYAGTLSGKTKMWLESGIKAIGVSDKLAGAFSTAAFIHGGGDVAIQSILFHMMVGGALLYSGGAAKGQPFIHYGPVAISPNLDDYADLFKTYGRRMGQKAVELF